MEQGKIILVTGGARSGKSTFAENLLKDKDDVLYIATSVITDEEMQDRVIKHKERRNPKWGTLEGYKNLAEKIEDFDNKYMLLDCVTVMTTNTLFDQEQGLLSIGLDNNFDFISMEDVDKITARLKEEFKKLIEKSRELNRTLVLVTNEVGWSLVPEYKLGRIFRDTAGFINQYIGSLSDEVYLVCCGQPLKIK
ncbi:adenosylcobinamide kinase/adenosylcobinamide-phosphate guanylyltransferase [Clostridium pascui]|uniref:bifunctional adenosylcobinamide kinase/adenosylcobinamide-phosphate guanylyltransferase n=1 Tax=Clostridium pascui TaxID=46609 RepID=UPI00195E3514|nr:bifunctional adenosylcobinamide kinase/adenosylcobinamide-phosphate guanylyltransferase [Clostridium pascui]MBM7870850.1 adenosylcobinamide kinase/adenosylcobinamide-phosphate guanylyltransferase [Clostridium pascui]